MWPLAAFMLTVALVALHLRWRRRHHLLELRVADETRKLQALEEHQREIYSTADAQREALFNSMLEGFLLLDSTGHIQSANQALTKLFETGGEIRGKTLLEAFRLPLLEEVAQRVAREGQVRGFEFEIPTPVPRRIEVNAAALYDAGHRLQSMVLVFHDLTRLKELENTRREFVANVSHELRTPLTLIKGYAETLLDGALKDPAVAERFVQIIEKHTDRLTFLIEDLLTISRLESGQIILNKQEGPVRPVVERVLEDLQSKAEEKKIRLINKISPEFTVHADFDRLEQIFLNLIDNAVKYGRPGGEVTISGTKTERGPQICVADDGPGIPADARERVFERFYRLDRARSREQGGTGLGLSIVKHIVQSHGGEVWVESQPDKGASFYFTLAWDH